MKNESYGKIVQLAKGYLEKYGALSLPFLMRKFKIDEETCLKVMNELGIKTREQQVEEYVAKVRIEMKEEAEKRFHEYCEKRKSDAKRYARTEKGQQAKRKGDLKRQEILRNLKDGMGDVEKWHVTKFYKACPKGYQVDHIIPVSKGGLHTLENLQYLPIEKNRRKFTKTMEDAQKYFDALSI